VDLRTKNPQPKQPPIFVQDFGVILHQPLNLTKNRKNSKKGQKMNGVPVCLRRILQNAPTWRSQNHFGRGLFLPYFSYFSSLQPHTSNHTIILHHRKYREMNDTDQQQKRTCVIYSISSLPIITR